MSRSGSKSPSGSGIARSVDWSPPRVRLAVCFLVVGTVVAFWPGTTFDFTVYDDRAYVADTPHVNRGLSWENVRWALTTTYFSYWHPLTWMSHMLDCEWFGLHAGAHHAMNLFWHVANTVVLFLVLRRYTKTSAASAWV